MCCVAGPRGGAEDACAGHASARARATAPRAAGRGAACGPGPPPAPPPPPAPQPQLQQRQPHPRHRPPEDQAQEVRHTQTGNGLVNDTLNTFYLRVYGVGHMVKDHSDNKRGNLLPPHGLLLSNSSKGSFICNI